ncbi:LOW QUALITY PROTEIN: protein mono-ADP-ribosyltransferase PARP14-like [Boleophthalmus pectinirostris]|uniref:LOW QUALITY PROTEIN: protein mono-ADP-ribosyltransferase PARP14-like n=1 Tax=Boleophthalmus pectinirostris TaxID=150288 RepID=UPI00242DDDE7|nr:LOW QUALITY PROTEIN: protein mono-ADP-ribosyltransferase PARP14-like [Boleophthalmus pectinirostris]
MAEAGVVVEGDWAPEQNRTVKNKLLKHFLSEKKSGGGECRVETVDGVARAVVHFTSHQVRDRVLSKPDHEITVDQTSVRLRLRAANSPIQTSTSNVPDPQKTDEQKNAARTQESKPDRGSSSGCVARCSVALGPVPEDMSRDLLCVLVENVCGLEETEYDLELIWELSVAVVTFKNHTDAEKFMSLSQSSSKLSKRGLTATLLEPATNVRVENLPPAVVKDMLDLYFEKKWEAPDDIQMVPEEQAAVLSFSDPTVVKDICSQSDLTIKSTKIKVYPYYTSLGVALMGEDRPQFKMPEAFTENVHIPVWKFLCSKNLSDSINQNMSPHFCHVNMDTPQVKLSPSPNFLRQNNLTKDQVENWRPSALKAFREQMNEYGAFDCPVNEDAWRLVEKEVRAIVKDEAELTLDQSKDFLTVASSFRILKRIRAEVEAAVRKAVNQIDRQMNGVQENVILTPAKFHILKESGLQKAVRDISPDLLMHFDKGVLTISGLQSEVLRLKTWILEKNMSLEKKQLEIPLPLKDFLQKIDVNQLSQDLFTSQGICTFISLEPKGIFLIGSSERFISDAENKVKSVLAVQALNFQDKEVVMLKKWSDLMKSLLDSYNTSNKQTVQVQIQPPKITIAGFFNPVKEMAQSLSDFINSYSRVQERVKVESCAVIQFIEKKKIEEWNKIAKDNQVRYEFDPVRPKFTISGARIHVQNAKTLYHNLTRSLITDTFQVQKPGAKKFFKNQGSFFLSACLNEFGCAVILRPELPDDDDEFEEVLDVQDGGCVVRVTTKSGVEVSVRKANMCKLSVDAVVNAANEELKHIGGLALALLNAAGHEMQQDCDEFIRKNGKLPEGQTFVTKSYRLPCKHVIHAVGPRYTENKAKLAHFLLKLAVIDCLTQAEKLQCASVAMPALSSGVFGFPVDLCTETIAQTVREFCDDPQNTLVSLRQVQLVDNNDKTVKALAEAVKREFSDLKPTTGSDKTRVQTEGAVGGSEPGWETVLYEEINQPEKKDVSRGKATGNRLSNHQQFKPKSKGQTLEQTTPEGVSISLVNGNIQDQTTDVIVNTIAENMILQQGAVSKALLAAAGPELQAAVLSSVSEDKLPFGEVIITDSFNLRCQKVFHAVCPPWDNGAGPAQAMLEGIVQLCLEEAERRRLSSISFPALGTGNLNFPRPVVSALMLRQVRTFSQARSPRHLRAVQLVVHPADTQTVQCFTNEFTGQSQQRNVQTEAEFKPFPQPRVRSQQSSASFGQVQTPSLGVHQMQMGHVTLEVSSGDITKETCDVIINSSNENFTLKTGVSRAILEAAGRAVELECANIVSSSGYQPRPLIITSAGQLQCRNIIHVTGTNKPPVIKDLVYSVLKLCEDNSFSSVAFPAIGTGAGGADPSLVAEAMVGAVEDFVKKKQPKIVRRVKVLVFQTVMIPEFLKSMKSREGQPVTIGFIDKVKAFVSPLTSFLGLSSEGPVKDAPVLEGQEIEPTVFQLCAETQRAITQTKLRIEDLIVTEQAERTISDPLLVHLTQSDVKRLSEMQKSLTVKITLERRNPEEPTIRLEGLTRDVSAAESEVRDMIRKAERGEARKKDAFILSGVIEWQFVQDDGGKKPFDPMTNLELEEAFIQKKTTKIIINQETFTANPQRMRADAERRRKTVELIRKECKDDASLPSEWSDMKSKELVKLVTLQPGSTEYNKVENEVTQHGLQLNIISIERVQNPTLWKNYQIKKKEMDTKNQGKSNEKVLFHGTGANSIDLINKQGFNRSYAGAQAAMYGNGSYFAVDPAYSARGYSKPDNKGHKRLYVALVLVGEFTRGQAGMITPPAKSNPSDLYDSVTDQVPNPTMFIIFNDVQAYPQYLITFT